MILRVDASNDMRDEVRRAGGDAAASHHHPTAFEHGGYSSTKEAQIMYIERHKLVIPAGATAEASLASTSGNADALEVYSGTKAVKNYGITVQGSGTTASGSVSGSLKTYDYKALYSVYQLNSSESAGVWFLSYHQNSSQDELKKTFESAKTLTTHYDVNFTIQGNNQGINSVFITFEVIRIVSAGVTKDFVVTNPESSGANNPDGSKYEGKYTPQQ